jgi:hypothetical protein
VKYTYPIFVLLLLLSACDLPDQYFAPPPKCTPDKQLALEGDPLSPENQELLRKRLKNKKPEQYRYFFKTFLDEGKNTYMVTNFRNDFTCFDVKVLVQRWDKLEGMRRANGESYPKELFDLKWQIKEVDGKEEVLYVDMHRIID